MFQNRHIILFTISIILLEPFVNTIFAEKSGDDKKEKNKPKEYCKDYGGEWNDDKEKCEIEGDEERTYYEDDVCDDPDDSDRYPKICKPWLFED
jgi:hypothetical protein